MISTQPGLALSLASERTRTQKIAATKFFGSRSHAGRNDATFVRATRRIFFGNFAILSRELGAKKVVMPTLDDRFFGSEYNADSFNSRRRCELCAMHAGRLHAFFWARDVPDFRKFCKFFARFLRNICVISTLNSRVILHSNAHGPGSELLQRISAVRAATLAELTQLLCARRAEIYRKLRNSFASWAQNLRDADAGRLL